MTTDLTSGTIPAFYRRVFDVCSHNGEPIHRDVYKLLLNMCKLSADQAKTIWDVAGPSQGSITRSNLYKSLALAAWAQQGKALSEKLLDNAAGAEYPTPNIDDLTPLKNLVVLLNMKANPSVLGLSYVEITQLDSITLELVPEKKGLFLKYSQYLVTSQRFSSQVVRRYNDFVALQELLLARFPYRMVPRLPPKKIVSDAHFLETRRRALHRWLTLISRHPTVCHDALVAFFLTDTTAECQHRIRDLFRRAPDEFMTSDLAGCAKDWLPLTQSGDMASGRTDKIRTLVQIVGKMKAISEAAVTRAEAEARDWLDLGAQLTQLTAVNVSVWADVRKSFAHVAKQLECVGAKVQRNCEQEQRNVTEKLALILDLLVSHKDLCERLEKGLAHDHQQALGKMVGLKKRRIQGVIRGNDVESVGELEAKMLAQEDIISKIELRADFSFYCVHMETQLVHAYLETIGPILNNLVTGRVKNHSELATLWESLEPHVAHDFQLSNGQN